MLATLELRRQLPFTTSSTIRKRKMSRPEDLPRSASPLKRRAPSVPLEDNPDATQDVDMLSLPPSAANQDTPVADGESIEGVEEVVQEESADSPRDDASTAAQVDDIDEDLPSLNGLDMDRASVGETQVGSDIGDHNLSADHPAGDDSQEQNAEPRKEDERNSGESKDPTQIESSTTNTDEAADSDSKTVDTAATSTSVDGAVKNGKSTLCALRSVLR